MPFETDDGQAVDFRQGFGREPAPPQAITSDVFGAAFRQNNTIGSLVSSKSNSGPFTPQDDYSAITDIKDSTYFENHADRFMGSRSPAETTAIKRQIDQEEHDKQTLASAGVVGVLVSMGAGMLDPTMLLPGRVAVGVAKDGSTLVRGAMEVGGAMAVQSTVQETALQASQQTRTVGESILNVGSATILGGLMGGGFAALSKAERFAHTTALNVDRAGMEAHAKGETLAEGFDVFHGSPHDLEQFDSNLIGSGEGAQAFGHGIYFAENQDVARFYANMRRRQAERLQGRHDKALDNLKDPEIAEAAFHSPLDAEISGEFPSNVYRVRLHAERDDFLDWDRPIDQQSAPVQEALKRSGIEVAPGDTGESIIKREGARVGNSEASKALKEAGVKGIKYLDAKSRAAGEGTRNFVLFDDRLARVTHKNGEQIIRPIGAEAKPEPASAPALATGTGLAMSGGAAATDTRRLDLVPTGTRIERVPTDPVLRTYQQPSVAARRGMADLAETAVLVKENLEGKTTTSGGAPLETIKRTQDLSSQAGIRDKLMEAWGDYRFNGKPPRAAILRDQLGMLDRGQAPTFEEFKALVSDAMMNGDKHDIPQVQGAAQQIRQHFEPWVARAEKAIPEFEKLEPKEGEGYFPHAWNKPQIQAMRPEFTNKLTAHYAEDQAAKASAQGRLRAYQNSLDVHEASIKKYTARLEKKQADLETDEALRDEVSKINKFAFQRATALRESEFKNVGGIREAVPGKNIEKARGGAVFETKVRERGNTLSDRASAHAAEVEEIETKLNRAHDDAASVRKQIETELGKWEGKSSGEAKSALKAREKYEAERAAKAAEKGEKPPTKRLTSADDAIDKAVQRILASDRDKSLEDLRARANETTDRILSSPDGRLPYDDGAGKPIYGPQMGGDPMRGSLGKRMLDVSNAFARDWIERDVEKVLQNFNRTFMPDVLLAERFGDVAMENTFRQVNEEYAALIDATGPGKERTALGKMRDRTIADLAATRDRFRGLYNVPTTQSQRNIARISGAVRNAMVPLNLGMAAVSSMSDAAGPVFQWGMASAFRDGWAPFVKSLMTNREYSREALREARVAGIAIDTFTANRHHELAGIADGYHPNSPLERTLQWGADKFQLVNGLAYWTDLVKTIAMTVNSQNLYRAVKAAAANTATKKQMMELGSANIPPALYEKIAAQYEKSGKEVDGVLLPNTADWTHETREAFEGALSRNVNINVVTPGLDKPLFMSDPTWAVLTQFKSFTAAAHNRILIANLQRADAQTLQGVVASLALGMVSYKFNAIVGGSPTSDRPQDWIKEAAARGSLFGWLEEGNALSSKLTRGGLDMYRLIGSDKPLSKYAGRTVMDQLLGPTFGKLSDLASITGSTASRDWTASDVKAMRRFIPAQNLFWLRGAFNQVEQGADNAFGIPPKAAKQ